VRLVKPNLLLVRNTMMINRRTLFLSGFPILGLAAACTPARAPAAQNTPSTRPAQSPPPGLAGLASTDGQPVWMLFEGRVRKSLDNSDPRPVILNRAVTIGLPNQPPRFFDQWIVDGRPYVAGPSQSTEPATFAEGINDLGDVGVWVERRFSLDRFEKPVEFSRLATQSARMMIIDANEVWLVDGGVTNTPPTLAPAEKAAFDAWVVAQR
jgi:hypothetical protein